MGPPDGDSADFDPDGQPAGALRSRFKSESFRHVSGGGSIERALPGRTTMTINLTDSRGVHDMREEQINAINPLYGVLPYPDRATSTCTPTPGCTRTTGDYQREYEVNTHVSLNGYWAWTDYHTNVTGIPSNEFISIRTGPGRNPSNRFNLIGRWAALRMDGFSYVHGQFVDPIQYYDRRRQ